MHVQTHSWFSWKIASRHNDGRNNYWNFCILQVKKGKLNQTKLMFNVDVSWTYW